MPQKKNPDSLELIRGKSARAIGNLTSFLSLLKGLPLAYNKDLQEDKELLFDSLDTVTDCLLVAQVVIRTMKVNRSEASRAVQGGFLNATDLADYLVRKGVPFRHAHHAVGAVVAAAERLGKKLNQLSLADFQAAHASFEADVLEVFDLHKAMAARKLAGSPGTQEVRKQLESWRKRLKAA